jgi:hypothetical protein
MQLFRLAMAVSLLLVAACSRRQAPLPAAEPRNDVYYWRTDLRLDSLERVFLKRYDIGKVYCRYFDVVMQEGEPMPNATITFSDTLPPGVELVPTVYITEDCMHEHHEGLAAKLVRRICQMHETNDLAPFGELQIDCDYTARSRQTYYAFLTEVKQALTALPAACFGHPSPGQPHPSPLLSTTIRLHQLSMAAPPADYGVLMLYNTGDPQRFTERNPILDMRDVQPYLRHLAGYPLPLAAAYPVFTWVRTISGVRVEHAAEAAEVLRVKQAVEQRRPELRQQILTYHLDKENIKRYTPESYEKIYRH